MHPLPLATAALLICAAPLAWPGETSSLRRCQSPDGTPVYTDKACAAFGARPTPMPGALLARIAREQRRSARASAFAGTADATLPLTGDGRAHPPVGRRSPAAGCARTPRQLAMDLRGALALGDVNRVAESYHWAGMSGRAGERTLDRLQGLTGKTVLDSQYYDARIGLADATDAWASVAAPPGAGGEAGILQLVLGADDAPAVIDFDVRRYAGCYFVSF